MATEPLRLCVNCKHYHKGYIYSCRRDIEVTYTTSVVDGITRKSETAGENACSERKYEGIHYCGPAAKFYVEKRLFKRLIAMFKA